MKIGLIGLPQTGKKTLFELLTNHKPTENEISSQKPVKGVAEIKDPRFERLVGMYAPKRAVRARIEVELFPKLERQTISKGEIFADINELDAICHCVRAFKDDSIYHADGSVDPKRDIDFVNSELLLYDLIFVEKRLERLELKIGKTKEEAALKEKDLLLKLKAHLDKALPLRLLELAPEEKRMLSGYPLVTRKAMIIALNCSDGDLKDARLMDELRYEMGPLKIEAIQISAKAESEIAAMGSEGEREEFLELLGITEPAINMLTRSSIKVLDLISFFTVGDDEVRQWTIRAGSSAAEAAGSIHTDLQRGFIRAEVMKYGDLVELGSESKAREAGRFYLKGRDYMVEDGDIINIRFSV